MTNKFTEEKLKLFRAKFVREDGLLDIGKYDHEEIEDFLFQTIEEARKEEREEVVEVIKQYFYKRQQNPIMHEKIFWSDVSEDIINLLNK